jgi:hypothetical protein
MRSSDESVVSGQRPVTGVAGQLRGSFRGE